METVSGQHILLHICRATIIALFALLALACYAQDAGEGITGARHDQHGPTPPDINFDPGPLKVVDSEWMNNKIGIDNEVPVPWTQLKRTGNAVSCWDRTYTLDSAFPTAIHGRDKELLSRPMRIVARIDDKTYRLSNSQVRFTAERGDHIDFAATGDLGPIKLRATNWIEFDGMVRIKFDLDAGSGLDVEYLGLEIPMTSSVAKYYYFCNGEWGGKPLGAIGAAPGCKWGTQWWPSCWVGDDDRGLTFVVESTQGWLPTPEGYTHEFVRGQDEMLWQIHILGKPRRMTGNNRYLIGLQATPMKPMRKDMAGFNPCLAVWSAGPKYLSGAAASQWPDRLESIYPDTDKGIAEFKEMGTNSITMWWATRWVCFPEYRNPDKIKNAIAKWHKAGMTVTQYMSTYFQGYESDVYKRHKDEWAHLRSDGKSYCEAYNALPEGNIGYVTCCPRSSFGDFMVWGVDYLMRTYGIDGLGYVDAPGPLYCANAAHGCKGGTYPVFRDREIFKRWWKVVKKYKPNGYIWAHTSENFCSPIMAYMDGYIVGEEFRPAVHPLTDLDKTRLAVNMTGLQWGSQPMWMYQCSGGHVENTTWVTTRILPYGAIPVEDWADSTVVAPAQQAKIRFGVGRRDTKFHAPHQLPDWLKMNDKDFVVGCWERADGAVLLVISNFGSESKVAKINGAAFDRNGAFGIARDAISGARALSIGNETQVCVPANEFRMIAIEPGKGK